MKRLFFLATLSMLVVAFSANVALGQARGPSGADGTYNCEDFDTQASAQRYFEANNPQQDPDGLDGAIGFDSTGTPGVACENLPGPTDLTPAPGYDSNPTTEAPTTMMGEPPTPPETMQGNTMMEPTTTPAETQGAGGTNDLPNTGGPPLALFTGVLFMGAGIVGLVLMRRRTE